MLKTPSPAPLCIRADAGTRMGIGHVMRCLALAQAWQDRGGRVVFITAAQSPALLQRLKLENVDVRHLQSLEATPEDAAETITIARNAAADCIVLDGYHFNPNYRSALKASGLQPLVIDDFSDTDLSQADFILNQNAYASESMYAGRSGRARLALGAPFALLRREFLPWRNTQRDYPAQAREILVTLGGSDPDNVTSRVLEALAAFGDWRLKLRIIVGGANPHLECLEVLLPQLRLSHDAEILVNPPNLPELMSGSDLVISASGSSCWELACLGVPMVLLVVADNQRGIAAELETLGAAVSLGWAHGCAVEPWTVAIAEVLRSEERRRNLSVAARGLIDGRGAARIAASLQGVYSVTIGTAPGGWLRESLSLLVETLEKAGHTVRVATTVDEMAGGDFLLLLSFWGIVPAPVLARYLHSLVVHASDLPRGRGWSPATWAILAGQRNIPICLLEAADRVDCGDIYLRDEVLLSGHELVDEWRALLAMKTAELCLRFVGGFPSILNTRETQSGEPSYHPRRGPKDSQLETNKTLAECFNLLRVVDNESYPAFFEIEGIRYLLKIEKASK